MSGPPIRIGLVGLGKIAQDQHLPALNADPAFVLAATASPDGGAIGGVPHYPSLDAMLARGPELDAVALCTPPQVRHALAQRALAAGLHVMLEKPPAASLAEVRALTAQADGGGQTLFAAWHSRFASGVEPARAWLATRNVHSVSIIWREDVRKWHPGQAWIWEPGGLGVFDPGINALSIATHILPEPLMLKSARLITPDNRFAPIAAQLDLRMAGGAAASMDLDWRQTGTQTWEITVETDAGPLLLAAGGARLTLPGEAEEHFEDREYAGLYARFAELIRERRSDVDIAPFRLVADAFLLGRREASEAFLE